MWKRWLIFLLVVVVLGLGVRGLWNWRTRSQMQQLAQYGKQVNDADAYVRLLAVEGLLRHDPDHEEHRLVRAKALIELSRHAEAREELQGLIEQGTPRLEEYVALQIDSFFSEVEKLIGGGDRQRSDNVIERVETMMAAVKSQAGLITGKDHRFTVMLIEARRLNALATAQRLVLQGRQIELTKARLGGIQQTIETVGIEVAELETKVNQLDANLLKVCGALMELRPGHALAGEILFHLHLRRGEFGQARSLARSLVALDEIPTRTVARVVDGLMDMEVQYAESITADDITLAGQLLDHPNQPGDRGIDYQLAQAVHAIAAGDSERATAFAHAIVAQEWLHARALCIAARARIIDGQPMRAVEILQKYTELKRDPLVRYTLGLAYLATGDPRQVGPGQEALRQCLDIEPNHLPARLRLIESFVASNAIIQAADDVKVVEQINPRHPRVLALKAQLAIESEDLETIALLIDQQLAADATALHAADVAMVVAMVLDDVPRVKRLRGELAAMQRTNVFVLLADRWMQSEALRRARLAPLIARHLLAHLESDPLASIAPPRVPVIGSLALGNAPTGAAAADPLEPMHRSHFMPRPLEVALEITELGLDRWPSSTLLISTAMELNIWLNRVPQARQWMRRLPPDLVFADHSIEALAAAYLNGKFDEVQKLIGEATLKNHGTLTPTHRLLDLDMALRSQDAKRISDSLTAMLQAHPWAEQALLMVIVDAMRREQPDRAFALLGTVEQNNVQLASLVRGRLNVGLGRAAEALLDVEKVVATENAGTEVRRWAAEVRLRAHLLLDQQSLAVGLCDQLAITLKENKTDASLAAADVLLACGKPTSAAEVLAEIAANPDLPQRTLDQVLARAEQVMKPSRIRALVESLLNYRSGDPVLVIYQARAIAAEDDLVGERLLKSVIARHPQAPRPLLEMARFMRTIQPDETRRIYMELSQRGGRLGERAQLLLNELDGPGKKPSSSASVEGITE